VSPVFRFHGNRATPGGFDVYDDPGYGIGEPVLSDDEFAEPARAEHRVPYPF
jgi:hypothetical protein